MIDIILFTLGTLIAWIGLPYLFIKIAQIWGDALGRHRR
tara:strand:- start:379 stop:495 length:117 start_codon:yes stop_codon:yes gene_type:complete